MLQHEPAILDRVQYRDQDPEQEAVEEDVFSHFLILRALEFPGNARCHQTRAGAHYRESSCDRGAADADHVRHEADHGGDPDGLKAC